MFVLFIILIITILLAQNTDKANFKFLWGSFQISKLVIMTGVSVAGFILGILAGNSSRTNDRDDTDEENAPSRRGKLNEEDNDYLN